MTEIEYLLICLAEECSEVAKIASKTLRFGLEEKREGYEKNNRERLEEELIDLFTVMEVLSEKGVKLNIFQPNKIMAKKEKIEKYYQYSLACKKQL